MKHHWVKATFRWAFLAAYVGACALILVESAIDGSGSSKQSDVITAQVEALFNRNYDRREVKELEDFTVTFDKAPAKNVFHTGDVVNYSLSFFPSDASDQTLKWTINKGENVISLDEANHQISVLSYGEASVNVSSIKKPELSKTFTFVSEKIPVERIEVESEISLIAGDAKLYTIQTAVFPKNADEKGLKFVSNNPDIIQVDESEGSLKARAPGEATISIASLDNPSVCASVHVTSFAPDTIELELRNIALNTQEIVLNENLPNALVEGTYDDAGAAFDPDKINVYLGEFSNLVTVSDKKLTSPGRFSFRLGLNDPSLGEKEGFADLLGNIEVIYQDFPMRETSLALSIKRLKTITKDAIDEAKIQKDITGHYIHLDNLGVRYIEPVSIVIPFKNGFRPSDYKQDGRFVISDSHLVVSSNSYSTFKAAPEEEIEGLAGDVAYVVGGVELLTFHYSYSKIEDDSCTSLDVGLSQFSETETTEFLIDEFYDESDFDGLFETYVSSDSKNPDVVEALKSAPLSFVSSDSTILDIGSSSELSSFHFLKAEEAKLTVNFFTNKKEYSLRGVDSPNECLLKVDGESFEDENLVLGRGDTKTLFAEGLVVTNLKEGKIYRSLDCTIKGDLPAEYSDYVSIKNDAKGAYFALRGVQKSEDSIPLTIEISDGKSFSKTLTKNLSVNYVPVTSLKMEVTLVKATDEYNSPNEDCSIVPLGAVIKGQVTTNEDATNKRAVYSSSHENVLKVDPSSGLIEAIGVGVAQIKAVSQDDMTQVSTLNIRVVDSVSPFELDLDKMSLPSSSINGDGSYRVCLDYGDSYRLYAKAKASCSTTRFVSSYAESSRTHIVRVDSSGLISSLGVGEETLEIGYKNELASYSVKVTFEVRRNLGFTLEQLALLVRKGVGHFSLFAFTAALSLGFIFLTFDKPAQQYIALGISSVLGFLMAAVSEFIQLFTAGRYGAWSDVGIDTAGYMTSIVFAALILGIVLLVRKKKAKKASMEEENAK